jgi:hypothetical protein
MVLFNEISGISRCSKIFQKLEDLTYPANGLGAEILGKSVIS